MKKTTTIFMTAVVTAILFSAVIFSACTKSSNNNTTPDLCAGVTCQNGGACSSGVCTCPTGYSGTYCQTVATTTIQYNNNTYTPVKITVNSTTSTIPVGGNITYTGSYGSTLTGTAYTYGATAGGIQIGTQRNWNLSNIFPSSGTLSVGIDVSSGVFYIKIINNNPTYSMQGLYVNYGTSNQTFDNNFIVPNNGLVYGVGYYEANVGEEIYLLSNPSGTSWTDYPTFLFLQNQSITVSLP